jgi:hypothetical protein
MKSKKSKASKPNPTDPDVEVPGADPLPEKARDSFIDDAATGYRTPASNQLNEPTGNSHEITQEPSLEAVDRGKVVELATTLVAAQIAAASHFDASKQLASAFKRIAGEFFMASARLKSDLETLHSTPELIDSAFVDRAYSQLMLSADATISAPQTLLPLDHSGLDDLFAGALARAQQLLCSPLQDAGVVYAEQLFSPEECLTENKIGDRLKDWHWPVLRNRQEYHKFMVRVETWFVSHLEAISSGPDENFLEDSELIAAVINIGRERAKSELFEKISELVRSHNPPLVETESYRGSFEHVTEAAWRRSLIQTIFDQRMPELRSEARLIRRYRPWGLFRYLRHWGTEDDEGQKLGLMLSSPRKDLRSNLSPHPLNQNADQRHDFGPLDVLVRHRNSGGTDGSQ